MNNNSESLPARVKVVCPKCGRTITTGQSGNSTRCPISRGGCGTTVYVPAGQTRPPVTLICRHCRSLWDTRAAAGNMVRCPSCKAPRRVPAAIRKEPEYAPAPERRPHRPAAPRSTPRPAPAPTPVRRPAPAATPVPTLAGLLRGLTRPAPTTRRPPDPAPAPSEWPPPAPPYRPAPPVGRGIPTPGRVAPAPPDSSRDRRRRDSAGQLVTSMGGALRLAYDTPHGMCEVMDVSQPRDRQRCRGVASRGVVFWSQLSQEVTAYACPAHAVTLAAATDAHPGITATVVGLNI